MKPVLPVLAALLLSATTAFAADQAALAGPPAGWPQALAGFREAGRGGDARAAYWAGLMVRNGKGTAPDSGAASAWLEQAAQGGVPEAMFVLANMRIEGEGGGADAAAGRAWLERAAALGHPAALQQLAQMADGDDATERANALLEQAAHALKHQR